MLQESMLEHDTLYQQCYGLLRKAKHSSIEREAVRLHAQSTERIVQGVISRLSSIMMPQGSVHRKVKALIDAVNDA